MSYMPDPKAKPASTDPKRGKYVAKPAPKPVYAGVHVGKPKPPVSEAINSPFTRDSYPALTDAIRGVVNGQPREVEEEVTPKRMEVLNRAVKTGMAGGLRNEKSRALAHRASLAITRAYATKDGKKLTGFAKAKREHEGAKARHIYLRDLGLDEDIQTPAREREMLGKMKRAEARTDAEGKRYRLSKDLTSKRYNAALSAQDKTYATQRKEEMSRRLYGKGGKLVKRAVKESQELDERIIDGVDAFQAAKNWLKGKGFKTNREVSYAKVQKNYEAMKKRQAEEAKKNK